MTYKGREGVCNINANKGRGVNISDILISGAETSRAEMEKGRNLWGQIRKGPKPLATL